MTRAKPATVRVYFDADVLGLAKLLCRERADFTYPGDPGGRSRSVSGPRAQSSPDTKDPVWIPTVAARGWLIVTRDRTIQSRPAEIAAVRENGAKMVNLSASETVGTWAQLEVFMSRWREIQALVGEPGPFIT